LRVRDWLKSWTPMVIVWPRSWAPMVVDWPKSWTPRRSCWIPSHLLPPGRPPLLAFKLPRGLAGARVLDKDRAAATAGSGVAGARFRSPPPPPLTPPMPSPTGGRGTAGLSLGYLKQR
jgi:hypothetical protein